MSTPVATRGARVILNGAPWVAAVLCCACVPPSAWGESTGGDLITMLSLAAGVFLLGIMRAFPVTDPDGFVDKNEIDALEFALRESMRILAFAAILAFLAILLLAFRPVLVVATTGIAAIDVWRGELFSAVLGWIMMFLLTRIIYVVRLDFSIMRKQAEAVRRAFDRRRSREAAQRRSASDDLGFSFRDEGEYPGHSREAGPRSH